MEPIILACLAAFIAGLVDSIAGGGGLIQIPALFFIFPNMPIVTMLGSNKLASSCGTFMSSLHYVRTLKVDFKALLPTLVIAFVFSIMGAKVVMLVDNEILKPLIFILLIFIAIYTFIKKNFGLHAQKRFSGTHLQIICISIGALLGFYDGFFGPGTGSILIFLFVSLLGFSFLEGSAYAKLINLAANCAALLFFALHHKIYYAAAVPMAAFNVAGNYIGARLAIKKGSGFVRWIFLAVIVCLVVQLILQNYHLFF
jgi:uncharacterized membrane protein YfcA